jgi:protein involved in polysaccharide export with SLBB domain
MKKNRYLLSIIIFLRVCSGVYVYAQSTSSQADAISNTELITNVSAETILARSSADYRVTPGDVYILTYAAGTNPVSYIILVDSSYRIRVSNLGVINGAGKTFMQLKSEVEATVSNNYPLSGVQLVLNQPAVFRVHVNGEVNKAGEVSAWGLSRLSSLLGDNLTAYSSIRDISIKSSNGQTRVYDLFKAQRYGDVSEDPYLRPGDVITFKRIKRLVTINGAVERPGTYQLQDGQNIKELIEIYGSGFTPVADNTRLEIVRLINSADVAGSKLFLTEKDLANNFELEHYDVITVPTISQLQPVMFVEGALIGGITSDLAGTTRITVQFNNGETYASLIRRNANWFTPVSDTQNAYIVRKNGRIPINLNPILFNASYRDDILVEDGDILIIPFRQYFVTVAGSVARPGRYPYIPDRKWEYYIGLAGGFIAERNAFNSINITDMDGKKRKKTDTILPETTITASTNHALYYFNLYSPVIVTVLSIVTTFLSIRAITGN